MSHTFQFCLVFTCLILMTCMCYNTRCWSLLALKGLIELVVTHHHFSSSSVFVYAVFLGVFFPSLKRDTGLLVFKALNGLGPRYLVKLLQYQNLSRTLCSNSLELLLQQKSNTKTYGDRAFSICAPRLWNSIPLDIRKWNSVSI